MDTAFRNTTQRAWLVAGFNCAGDNGAVNYFSYLADALIAVSSKIREAAFGIGATRWEAILGVFLPTAATGIFGEVILGFGRALRATMALAMLAGNANVLS
jgi:ABC-type phosphate transport system permease subunit